VVDDLICFQNGKAFESKEMQLTGLQLDKMLVDQVGEVLITNDGATILKRLDVEHPAGKVLVELAELQDKEVSYRAPICLLCDRGLKLVCRIHAPRARYHVSILQRCIFS
jgi:hypothetical protein